MSVQSGLKVLLGIVGVYVMYVILHEGCSQTRPVCTTIQGTVEYPDKVSNGDVYDVLITLVCSIDNMNSLLTKM